MPNNNNNNNKIDINFKSKKHDSKLNGSPMVNGEKVIKKPIQSFQANTSKQNSTKTIKVINQTNNNTTTATITATNRNDNNFKSIKEKFNDYQQKSTSGNMIGSDVPIQSESIINDNLNKSNHNNNNNKKSSIRRAFNKLKLFF